MKKRVIRAAAILLVFCLLFSASGCNSTKFKVTGKVEDGKLTVWYSPRYTEYKNSGHVTDNAYLFTDFCDDVVTVDFKSDEDFQTYLTQKMLAGEGPDIVFAFADELSPKLLAGDMFLDLNPFLDYEDTLKDPLDADSVSPTESATQSTSGSKTDDLLGVNIIPRKDLLMSAINACEINGKLTAMPVALQVSAYNASKADDIKDGLDLSEKTYTLDKFIEAVSKAEIKTKQFQEKNGTEIISHKYKYYPFSQLPEPYEIFKNFIDYSNDTTRMGEDAAYNYFCAYVKVFNKSYSYEQEYKKYLDAWAKDGYTQNSDAYKKFQEYRENDYIQPIYEKSLPYELNGIDAHWVRSYSKDISQSVIRALDKQNGYGQVGIPSEYGSDALFVDLPNTQVALIPANSKCPNKAFAYIKAFLSYGYMTDYGEGIPLNLKVIDTVFQTLALPKDMEKTLYQKVKGSTYVCNWMDDKVKAWFSALYLNEDGTLKNTIPTREEWNDLKDKIDLYLKE